MGNGKRQSGQERKNYVLWIAGGFLTLTIGAAYFCQPKGVKPVERTAVPALEQRVSRSDNKKDVLPGQIVLNYEYHGYDLVKAISVDIGEAVRKEWLRYAPVFAIVNGPGPELPYKEICLPVDQSSSFRYEVSPFHPANKIFMVYAQNKVTGDFFVLHTTSLNDLLPETRRK